MFNEVTFQYYKKINDSDLNDKVYNGATIKYGVTISGKDYIMKLPKNENDLSSINEFLASSIIKCFGVKSHNVELAVYKGTVVALIEDMSTNGLTLKPYSSLSENSVDTDLKNKYYTYDDIMYLISSHLKIDEATKSFFQEYFWNMFFVDAILANRDRHSGNWGFLVDNLNTYSFSPLYDNGSSLFPGVYQKLGDFVNIETRAQFLYDRVIGFPASQILRYSVEERRNKKTNFYQVVEEFQGFEMFDICLKDFIKRNVGWEYSVFNLIRATPVDDNLKLFYKAIIKLRYDCILLRRDFDEVYNEINGGLSL